MDKSDWLWLSVLAVAIIAMIIGPILDGDKSTKQWPSKRRFKAFFSAWQGEAVFV